MWKNIVEPDNPQMTLHNMSFALLVTKATATHSEYVMRIAFTWQNSLRERAAMFRLKYIACVV